MYSANVWALICHRRRTSRPPTLGNICLKIAPKVRHWEKRLHRSNSAARGPIAFKFHKVLYGTAEAAELSKPT